MQMPLLMAAVGDLPSFGEQGKHLVPLMGPAIANVIDLKRAELTSEQVVRTMYTLAATPDAVTDAVQQVCLARRDCQCVARRLRRAAPVRLSMPRQEARCMC